MKQKIDFDLLDRQRTEAWYHVENSQTYKEREHNLKVFHAIDQKLKLGIIAETRRCRIKD